MTVEIDPSLVSTPCVNEWRSAKAMFVDPIEPGRRYFSVELDCVSYTVVARDEDHLREIMPAVYAAQYGGEPDRTYEEALAEYGGLGIAEIEGTTTIWDDGRDGLQHPINTYALGMWASSEY